MTTKITKRNPDGTLETQTVDTRKVKEQLQGELTWAQKLDIMYPTPDADHVVEGWAQYDDHKLFK